jgi:FdrA protein
MTPALRAARKANRRVVLVASVCGTDADPQGLGRQEAALRGAGVLLAPSNAAAARIAARIVGGKRA